LPEESSTVPKPPPRDGCRADDAVRCPGGTEYICSAQLCDGTPDCPGDTDEDPKNCPDSIEGPILTPTDGRINNRFEKMFTVGD
jgi:hypothetical protein